MLCRNPECRHKTFQTEYSNNASRPGIKEKIIEREFERKISQVGIKKS